MLFRVANKSDSLQLAKLRWDFQNEFNELPVCSEKEFIKNCKLFFNDSIGQGSWFHWIAQTEARIIGTVSLYRVQSIPKPCQLNTAWGYVTNTYIIPAYRNQGIGSALMEQVKNNAKSQHMELLIAWPSQKSLNFYKRHGFHLNPELLELSL